MICTKPYLAHALSVVSRYMANLGKTHQQDVKWILRYLNGLNDVGLVFGRGEIEATNHVKGFCNLNYAGDLDHRSSLIGYIFTL